MRGRLFLTALFLVLLMGASFAPTIADAQNPNLSPEQREALERQLASLEKEIAATQGTIDSLYTEGESLKRDIAILDGEIKKAKLRVRATEVAIQQLTGTINTHSRNISMLTTKLSDEKDSLAQIMRNTQQIDDYSLVEVVMSAQNVSEFFGDLDNFAAVNAALYSSFDRIVSTRSEAEGAKVELEGERLSQEQLRQMHLVEQQNVQKQEAEKRDLLAKTKGQEDLYRQLKGVQERTAAQIRAALFPLRDTSGIQFGQAVEYARAASNQTGVRAALILAILSQESDLGKNVGNCYITNKPNVGDGVGKNTGTFFDGVMHPTRDVPVFLRVMDALGRDWSTTPISCPLPGGYGGAMGPTQFIPSTWAGYEGRLKATLGVAATDPWNPSHAIMATALYLQDLGAAAGGQAEHRAAAQYYAGGNWATAGQGYANSVIGKATGFQNDINILGGN